MSTLSEMIYVIKKVLLFMIIIIQYSHSCKTNKMILDIYKTNTELAEIDIETLY